MSALAYILDQKIVVKSHFVFYGGEATAALAIACIDEIEQMYNQAQGIIAYKGASYPVVFEPSAEVLSPADAAQKALQNTSTQNNFVRIEATKPAADPVSAHRSEMYLNNNAGFFVTTDNLGKSTTVAHEYGHSLGLVHPPPDQRGTGTPGIMAARGTLVDAPFRYGNWQETGYLGVAPTFRRVLAAEIALIFMDIDLSQQPADIGVASNFIYTANGIAERV